MIKSFLHSLSVPWTLDVVDGLWQPDVQRLWEQQSQQAAQHGHRADDDLSQERPDVIQHQDERSDRHAHAAHEVGVTHRALSAQRTSTRTAAHQAANKR